MELTTERLMLREFNQQDWPAVLAYQSDPRYLRYYPWVERTPEEVQVFVQMFIDQREERPRTKFQLALILKPDSQLIGNCGIRLESSSAFQGDIGFELAPKYWNRGYATEAAGAILRFGFTRLNLHRVWSWCIADNRASARVLEKLRMRLEGRLRENEYFKDRWWDTLMFGMLKSEWQAKYQMACI